MKQGRDRIKIFLVALWVTFTVTLAGWWMIFGLRQLDRLNQLHVEQADQLQKHYQMLLWEGGILIASLLGGGSAQGEVGSQGNRGRRRGPGANGSETDASGAG